MSPAKPRILLVPEGSLYLAFRLPPLFRKAGWEVDLLCVEGDPMAHSRHVGRVIREAGWGALSGRLHEILRDSSRPWQAVVVVEERTARRAIATGDDELLKRWQPGALNADVREFLLSKIGLPVAGRLAGVTLAPSRVCHTAAEIGDFGGEFGWPVVVKPPDESGGVGLLKFRSHAELAAAGDFACPLLAQKFISGRLGVVEMLCSVGRPLAWLASYCTRQRTGEFSPSVGRQFQAMPGLEPMVEALAQFTRFEGFCGFDFIEETGTGRYYLIEFHPRAPSGFRFGRACGLDFSRAISAWLNSNAANFPAEVQPPDGVVKAHYFSTDLVRCLRQRDWRGLRAWLPGSGTVHDVYWDDLPLFAAWTADRCRRAIRNIGRRSPESGSKGKYLSVAGTGSQKSV